MATNEASVNGREQSHLENDVNERLRCVGGGCEGAYFQVLGLIV